MKNYLIFFVALVMCFGLAGPASALFCNDTSQCPSGNICNDQSTCVLAPGNCYANSDCSPPNPVCNYPPGAYFGTCSTAPGPAGCYNSSQCTPPQICLGCSNDGTTVTMGYCGTNNTGVDCNSQSSGNTQVTLPNPLCLGGPGTFPDGSPKPCIEGFPALITKISVAVTGLIGALATIMLIYAGFLYVTSAGNEARLSTAKQALMYAIIGVAIALAATGLILAITAVVSP